MFWKIILVLKTYLVRLMIHLYSTITHLPHAEPFAKDIVPLEFSNLDLCQPTVYPLFLLHAKSLVGFHFFYL